MKMNKREQKLLEDLATARSKIYPNYYNGSGRWTQKSADYTASLVGILTGLGMVRGKHFERGNDAPQGGWTGDYVRLLPLGRRLKAIRDIRESAQ
jgi:hypothetical protein